MINLDNILTDKRFNFWNLPSKAKVLLVSNLPSALWKKRCLFNLFGLYGDVLKVKLLPHKEGVALVEFCTATMAMIARNHLDQQELSKRKIVVSFSWFDSIRDKEGEENYVESFDEEQFRKFHRFASEDLQKVHLKGVAKPSPTLHVSCVPPGMSVADVQKALSADDALAVERKMAPGKMEAYLKMSSPSLATATVATHSGTFASHALPEGLRLNFEESPLADLKGKFSSNDQVAVVDVNKKAISMPLPANTAPSSAASTAPSTAADEPAPSGEM